MLKVIHYVYIKLLALILCSFYIGQTIKLLSTRNDQNKNIVSIVQENTANFVIIKNIMVQFHGKMHQRYF